MDPLDPVAYLITEDLANGPVCEMEMSYYLIGRLYGMLLIGT